MAGRLIYNESPFMASEFSRDFLFPHLITRYDVRMKALIVVDYQVDFVTGALGFAGAEEIEGNILRLIEEYEGRTTCFCTKTKEGLVCGNSSG